MSWRPVVIESGIERPSLPGRGSSLSNQIIAEVREALFEKRL